jgi:predicted lipoprotein with Yx(FWY)xxD motif
MIKKFALCMLLTAAASMTLQAQQDTTDAVYEDMQHEYVLREDGSTLYTYSHKLKLLTPYAFTRAYGESFITYNPDWQTLKVTRSVTTMRDGQKVASPFNAFNEVLPRSAAGAAPFSHLKEMVVTHTGLEAGAVVDFAYTLETKPGMFPGLMGRVVCGDRNHIVQMTIRVKVPAGMELMHGFARDNVSPEITDDAGMTVYTWRRKHIPQYEVEAHQPSPDRVLPVLYFSTVPFDQLPLHVFGEGGPAPLPEHLVQLAANISEVHPEPLDRALALREWVAKRIGRSRVPLDMLGYKVRSVEEILEYNVGSDLDRAVMLAQLCRAMGIEAAPALFSHDITTGGMRITHMPDQQGGEMMEIGPEATPNVAALHLFPHAVVVCQGLAGHPLLVLDPSHDTQSGPFPAAYRKGFFLPIEGIPPHVWYSSSGPEVTTASITSDWSLGADGYVSGRSSVSVDGMRSQAFDPAAFKKQARSALASAAQGMTAEADTVDVRENGLTVCEVGVDAKTPLEEHGGYYAFRLPTAPGGISALHLPIGDRRRITPVALPGPMKEELRTVIHLDGFRAVDVPRPLEIRNNIGSVRSVIIADAHDVEITRVLTIDVDEIKPEGYVDLQELLRAWRHPAHNTLLFTRK